MPVQHGRDKDGPFYRYGQTGAKHRYRADDPADRERAQSAAERQGRAIRAAEHKRKDS